ncbi:MAG: MBL fold metallo-hydrolase RNA specificity domain-containing protein [Methanomassiliicoccales archaeon]|jgi:ribonuclease J
MAIEINVLTGSSSIGGNKILMKFDGRNVLFDFGYDYSVDKLYFDSYTNFRPNRGIHDPLEFGMLPRLGIYRRDMITDDCMAECSGFPHLKIDALFISHAHMDHFGMAGYLDAGIPFVATPMTLVLMKAIIDITSSPGTEAAYMSERECVDGFFLKASRSADKVGRKLISTSSPEGLEGFLSSSPLRTKGIIRERCGSLDALGFEARCFEVDHSIYGAAAFGVKTSDGWVVYTGDLRTHGINGPRTEEFAREAGKLRPKVLIIEGTRASRLEEVGGVTEAEVERRCLQACTGIDGPIIVDFGPRNIERLEAFARIASSVGRDLVVTAKDAYLLDAMKCADGEDRFEGIKVLKLPREQRHGYESCALSAHEGSVITLQQVCDSQNDHIICFSQYDMPHLLDVKPRGGLYLYSGSGSFDEEQDHDFERLDNWIRKFGMRRAGFDMVERMSHRGEPIMVPEFTPGFHASGHASKEVLKQLVETIRPEYLIPVHTQNPRFFVENISCVPSENILLPEDGKSMIIS